MLDGRGLEISSLAYYPNHLASRPDTAPRSTRISTTSIDAAVLLGVDVVGTFVGARPAPLADREPRARSPRSGPRSSIARAAKGVKIAIENCPMLFSGDEWPFGTNLACTPHIWREMFNVIPDAGFGLNLDPSHLVWQMIDYERVVYDFADRILHVHAKDMEIDRDGLYEHGVLSAGHELAGTAPARASARCAGIASARRSTPSATTAGSRSSTRTAPSRATWSWSSAGS